MVDGIISSMLEITKSYSSQRRNRKVTGLKEGEGAPLDKATLLFISVLTGKMARRSPIP